MNAETRAALALVEAGLPLGHVDLALRMLDLAESDTAESVGSKVAGLAEQLPALFPQQRGGHPTGGAPGRLPAAGDPVELRSVETDYERAQRLTPAERARARFASKHGGTGGGSVA